MVNTFEPSESDYITVFIPINALLSERATLCKQNQMFSQCKSKG